jgi:hypothetical protein
MVDDGFLIGFEDSSGNFVEVGRFNNLADDVTQPLEIKHQNSGERITLDSSGADVNSIAVGTVADKGDTFGLRERITNPTQTEVFTGLNSKKEYRLFYAFNVSSGTGVPYDLFVRANGDSAGNGNYAYFDSTGTRQTGENEMLLVDGNDQGTQAGALTFGITRFASEGFIGFNHSYMGGQISRINDFAREGSRESGNVTLQSIELSCTESIGSRSIIELWEREYQ